MKNQHIITVLSGKGGTGKTTIAANLAAVIAENHHNVLLIDFDVTTQAINLSVHAGSGNIQIGHRSGKAA